MRAMTSDELRNLTVGSTVVIKGQTKIVDKVGRKWITLNNGEKISIERARTNHPNYSQWEADVYATKEDYQAYENYCKSLDEARATIREFINKPSIKEVIAVAEFIKSLKEKGA